MDGFSQWEFNTNSSFLLGSVSDLSDCKITFSTGFLIQFLPAIQGPNRFTPTLSMTDFLVRFWHCFNYLCIVRDFSLVCLRLAGDAGDDGDDDDNDGDDDGDGGDGADHGDDD